MTPLDQIPTVAALWHTADVLEWDRALDRYWSLVKPQNLALERELNSLKLESLRSLGPTEWYEFLYEKYFRWKYTAANRLATTRASLRSYMEENALEALDRIRQRADIYEQVGRKLFARNIRGFLGTSKDINKQIARSLEKEPEYFWYYNNGITIVCDNAEQIGRAGRDVLRVENPQVINGQQTTRVLHSQAAVSKRAGVLVKVIRVPRDTNGNAGHFDELISNIVAATNSQNYITPSDLMSNDRRQVEIERHLRKLDYHYLRKRQTKGEARAAAGVRFRFMIQKTELAQAVAACDLDPVVVREGKERLFEERWYQHVFPNSDPVYYLPRYWLMVDVGYVAMGYPERAYAKWLVLHFVWTHLASVIKGRRAAELFWKDCEREEWITAPLLKAISAVFVAAIAFYRHNRGKGARATDVSTFFKKRGLDKQFESFWDGPRNRSRARFKRNWDRFASRLRQRLES